MVDAGTPPAVTRKKPSLTPKAIVHQNYGDKACYKVEEVQNCTDNGCLGLGILNKAPCLYRCTLNLPEITVVSDVFRKKKEAEQSASQMAIDKLGIHQKEYNPTVKEAWEDLSCHLAFLFSNEFLSSPQPLSGHFRAALRRANHLNGFVPISVIAVYGFKINNICKCIDPASEGNTELLMPLILRAAKHTDSLLVSDGELSLRRKSSYPPEVLSLLKQESQISQAFSIEVICIPSSLNETVESLWLNITPTSYYLDVIAHELGVAEASNVLISRSIGKTNADMRIYSSNQHRIDDMSQLEKGPLNAWASYLANQNIYGDAILASLGYPWMSSSLNHESVSLQSYYRMIMSKTPSGVYKVSRIPGLPAKLPSAFTTKSNWRGCLPRDALCTFCRYNHLSEPVFCTQNNSSDSLHDLPEALRTTDKDPQQSTKVYGCVVKIYTKTQELILQCSPPEHHRKQADALQRSALKVLHWLNLFFENPDMSLEDLNLLGKRFNLYATHHFLKEFAFCRHVQDFSRNMAVTVMDYEPSLFNVEGASIGITPPSGSLASIRYIISLVSQDDCTKQFIESCEEFEFEFGNDAVIPQVEAAIAQMSVGQSACFLSELLQLEHILAAAKDPVAAQNLLSSCTCKLEYTVSLMQITEPLEDRMEKALFTPPLSKQRVEFAVQYIKESCAALLIDFGCGSGSLLDSLLSCPTSLEKIIGVDISRKALARAAKLIHSKLNKLMESKVATCKIESAELYDGSITKFDSRLCGCDIATCLEVIEHMEEEDAWIFGDLALSSFFPKILIVSTPNYEYNMILQRSTPSSQDEDLDEKNQSSSCKFRNHDHKFEWTRQQFQHWACELASRHNYDVKFSGVGGSGDVEPGFASQIAIFRRLEDTIRMTIEGSRPCIPIWEWTRGANVQHKETP